MNARGSWLHAHLSWHHTPSTYRPRGAAPGRKRVRVLRRPFRAPVQSGEIVTSWRQDLSPARYGRTRVSMRRSRKRSAGNRRAGFRRPGRDRRSLPPLRWEMMLIAVRCCAVQPDDAPHLQVAAVPRRNRRASSRCIQGRGRFEKAARPRCSTKV